MKNQLQKKIQDRSAVVCVVGLGYVGLPLAVEAAKAGFKVRGIENNPTRCKKLNAGENYICDVRGAELEKLVKSGQIRASEDFSPIKEADVVIICVPTPLTKNKTPDVSYMVKSTEGIEKNFRSNSLIIMESTTYPGTTEEIVQARLAQDGLLPGKDYFLSYSPERVDPGNKNYNTANTPKLVGGVTTECSELTMEFYSAFINEVHQVSSPRVAETTKLFENVFRSVNIALVNELAILCERMNIDVYEVITAASTKPYGFQPFWPGPGVGGHCIPLDPYYLSWKGREYDFHARFIELAGEINESMPEYVLSRATEILNHNKKALTNSKVLQLGITYKKDIDDARESPSVHVYELLTRAGAKVDVCDPFVEEFWVREHDLTYGNEGPSIKTVPYNSKNVKNYDLILVTTDHSSFNYKEIAALANAILDTRNAFGFMGIKYENIFHLSSKIVSSGKKI